MRRRMQREARAGGVSVHRRLPSSLGDQGAEVFDLALDRVWLRVAAVAPAPAVVVDHHEVMRQLFGEWTGHRPVAGRPTDHDDRLTVTESFEGDRGAIRRSDLLDPLAHLQPPFRRSRRPSGRLTVEGFRFGLYLLLCLAF